MTKTSDRHPGSVSLTLQFSLQQSVFIPRLKRNLQVPTYTLVDGALLDEDDVRDRIEKDVLKLTRFFVERVKRISEAEEVSDSKNS